MRACLGLKRLPIIILFQDFPQIDSHSTSQAESLICLGQTGQSGAKSEKKMSSTLDNPQMIVAPDNNKSKKTNRGFQNKIMV